MSSKRTADGEDVPTETSPPQDVFPIAASDLATLLFAFTYYVDAERDQNLSPLSWSGRPLHIAAAFEQVYPPLEAGLRAGRPLGEVIDEIFERRPGQEHDSPLSRMHHGAQQ